MKNNDFLQFREKFIEDANELLSKLENDMLLLEKDKANMELIEAVFRVMHTLKGVASMYGFDNISNYTHHIENIYDSIRNHQFPLSTEIFDVTFQSIDHLRNLLNDADFKDKVNIKTHETLLIIIKKLSNNSHSDIDNQAVVIEDSTKNTDNEEGTWHIILRSDETYIKRGIKILTIFTELSEIGKFTIVGKTQSYSDVENTNEESWSIYLTTTADYDEIADIFMFILDDCKIVKISDTNLFDPLTNLNEPFLKDDVLSIIDEAKLMNKLEAENRLEPPIEQTTEVVQTTENETKTVDNNIVKQEHQNTRMSVDTEKLDHLMYLVGELITIDSQLTLSTGKNEIYKDINPYIEQLNKLSKQFRKNAIAIRLIPIRGMVLRFKRLIRDLSARLGKDVDFHIQGEEIELDKSTIDILAEPLMHILRNCLDHGIETPDIRRKNDKTPIGQINLFAYNQGNNVFINIQDDGAGIDTDKILNKAIEKGFVSKDAKLTKDEIYNLIFLPGFSMAQSLTEVSGRGVGMNVVRQKINEIRGEIEITSEIGLGTSFTIKLQQSISILDTMLIQVADMFYMLPLSDIEVCNLSSHDEIKDRLYTGTLPYENTLIPFIDLHQIFQLPYTSKKKLKTLVISKHDKKFALITDRIIGEHQAVLKPLGKTFQNQKLFTSASVLADGEMAFMLNTSALLTKVRSEK